MRRAVKSAEGSGPVQRLLEAQEQLKADGLSLPGLLGRALLVGLTFGTAFQVTHNNGLLPVRPPLPKKLIGCFLKVCQVPSH